MKVLTTLAKFFGFGGVRATELVTLDSAELARVGGGNSTQAPNANW